MTDDLDTPLYIRCSFRSLKPMLGVVCDSMGGGGSGRRGRRSGGGGPLLLSISGDQSPAHQAAARQPAVLLTAGKNDQR